MSIPTPIRVLHLVRPATGGIRQHVVDLVRFISVDEVTPSIAGPADLLAGLPPDVASASRTPVEIRPSFSPVQDVLAAMKLAGLVRMSAAGPGGEGRGGVRGVDVVHAHGLRSAWIAALARLICPFTWVYTAHNIVPRTRAARLGLSLIGRTASVVIAVSPAVKNSLAAAGVDARAIRVIPNGVDTRKLAELPKNARATWDLDANAFVVGCIARLSPEKGVDILLKAAQQMPDTTFLVAGDGPERDSLSSWASTNVRLIGRLDDVRLLLGAIDVLAVPSRHEGQGIVALEAMAAGVPVVASDVGGLSSTFAGTNAGLLVASENPEALAIGIRRLKTEPQLRRSLTESGHTLVRQQYDVRQTVAQVRLVYRQVNKQAAR